MQTTIAARKVEGKWEVALISNGRFVRALTGNDLTKLITPLLVGNLQNSAPDDTEVGINITTTPPEVKSDKPTDS